MAKHTIMVEVLAETRKFSAAMRDVANDSGLKRLGSFASTVGAGLLRFGAGAAAGAGVAVGAVTGMAGDLEQSLGAVDVVFKDSAKQVRDWAAGASQSVGLAENEYAGLATLLGTQLKNGGTAFDQIGGKTNELISLGADLSAMFGGTTADAVGALSSALKGERDPIEKFGVTLKQSMIDARAAEMGYSKVAGQLSAEAQQAATLSLIMEQTADAHGRFGAEAGTLQGQSQRLKTGLVNLATSIGQELLPYGTRLVSWANSDMLPMLTTWAGDLRGKLGPAITAAGAWISNTLIPAATNLWAVIQTNVLPVLVALAGWITGTLVPGLAGLVGWLIAARGWLLPLAAGLATIAAGVMIWVQALKTWRAITAAVAAAQALLNIVLAANPIGIIVLLIAGLVAALVVLYNNNETARRIIDGAWKAIKSGIDTVVRWVTGTAVPWLTRAWSSISSGVSGIGTTVAEFSAGVGRRIGEVIAFFTGIPGRIRTGLSSMGSTLASIGGNLITGLIDGITEHAGRLVDAVRGAVNGAINGAKKLLGIASPSRVFREIGRQTGAGLIDGLARMSAPIRAAATDMAAAVTEAGTPAAIQYHTAPASTTAALAAGGLHVHVHGLLHPTPDTGRVLAEALRPYLRTGGAL